jgi:hypothetical protein
LSRQGKAERCFGSGNVYRSGSPQPDVSAPRALIGGSASFGVAIYTQRTQLRLQRVASEIAKREAVYADFVMSASDLLLNAYVQDDIVLAVMRST